MKIHSCPILPHTVVLILKSVLVQQARRWSSFSENPFQILLQQHSIQDMLFSGIRQGNLQGILSIHQALWVLSFLYIRPRKTEMSVEDLWDNHPCVLQWVAFAVHGRTTPQVHICLSSFTNVSSDLLGLPNFNFNCTGVVEYMIIPSFHWPVQGSLCLCFTIIHQGVKIFLFLTLGTRQSLNSLLCQHCTDNPGTVCKLGQVNKMTGCIKGASPCWRKFR